MTTYEATIYHKLPNNRHKTKRIRFSVPDQSRQIFFQRHPEYHKPEYWVTVRQFSHMSCIRYFPGEIDSLDSWLAWIQRIYPKRKSADGWLNTSGHTPKTLIRSRKFDLPRMRLPEHEKLCFHRFQDSAIQMCKLRLHLHC